jgi:hypothetical protein
MTKQSPQWYSLTEEQLWRLVGQGTSPGADPALERVRKIKEAGRAFAIYYSEFSGFQVLDEDDPNEMRRSLSLRNRAKPFTRV